jgi:putative PIN family toxin of toxin-antitoxin system
MSRRVVIDTNVYVSRILNPLSVPGRAVAKVLEEDVLLVSSATWAELRMVLQRPKLVPFIQPGSVAPFLAMLHSLAVPVPIPTPIRACRDPRDDKFLEVAVHGHADVILTGDADLLLLHPFRGVSILPPTAYLELE